MSSSQPSSSFIFRGFNRVVTILCILSPVEWFKKALIRFCSDGSPESKQRIGALAIDLFIVLKWMVLALLWVLDCGGVLAASLIGYLLFMNNHTYFCYHLWFFEGAAKSDPNRERRRFLNLCFAAAYSVFGFAFFYAVVMADQFQWPPGINHNWSAILFSVGNSLTGFAGEAKPVSSLASALVSIQLVSTFVFIAILLSNSIPKTRD